MEPQPAAAAGPCGEEAACTPVLLPAGSFGAGGWSPGNRFAGKYTRLSVEECIKARKVFRSLLIKRYHSVIRAWRDIDKNGDGRLSLFEFMRGCQKLGVDQGARLYWEALDMDRSGFVTLQEVDADLARLLGSLAVCIWSHAGSVDKAWAGVFNRQGKNRIDKEEFAAACHIVNFPGDAEVAFDALRFEKATNGLSRQEFGFLELWFVEKLEKVSPLHDGLEPQPREHQSTGTSQPFELDPAARIVKLISQSKSPKLEFRALLKKSYGNMVRAWRLGLDRDRNGILSWREFQRVCSDVGYAGNRRDLWDELDADNSGGVSLREIDDQSAHMLEALLACVRKRYLSWKDAWDAVIDKRGDDRVERRAFISGCTVLGYGGNADRLFELLDLDRANYLTFETTSWMEGAERADRQEPQALTRSVQRMLDLKARENRLRQKNALMMERGLPGRVRGPSGAGAQPHGSPSQDGSRSLGSHSFSESRGNNLHVKCGDKKDVWDEEEPLPDWLLRIETERTHLAKSPGAAGRLGQRTQSRPLSPPVPGHGGWPGSRLRIVDPVWGGSSPTAAAEPVAAVSPLSRAVVSEPNLARWQAGVVG